MAAVDYQALVGDGLLMGDVVNANFYTKGDINPDGVLGGAIGELEQVVVIGVKHNGNVAFSSSTCDKDKILKLVDALRLELLNGDLD